MKTVAVAALLLMSIGPALGQGVSFSTPFGRFNVPVPPQYQQRPQQYVSPNVQRYNDAHAHDGDQNRQTEALLKTLDQDTRNCVAGYWYDNPGMIKKCQDDVAAKKKVVESIGDDPDLMACLKQRVPRNGMGYVSSTALQSTIQPCQQQIADARRAEEEKQEAEQKKADDEAAAIAARPGIILTAKVKGEAYGLASGTTWKLTTQPKDPMTDRAATTLRSDQFNGSGAVAEVEGNCVAPGQVMEFTALIVDEKGQATIGLPGYRPPDNNFQGRIVGTRRINEDPATTAVFPADEYRNKIVVAMVYRTKDAPTTPQPEQTKEDKAKAFLNVINNFSVVTNAILLGAQDADTNWRIMAKIDTNRQPVLIQVPLYDPSVRKTIEACLGTGQ